MDKLIIGLFSDADFAGDRKDFKSTTGVFAALMGPHTFFPLGAVSKKQTVCSNSTVEAEVVAAYAAVRATGISLLDLWEFIMGRKPTMYLFEDNQATMKIIQTGKYPTLRHVRRMHGVSISWLHDAHVAEHFTLWDCATDYQSADIFTKHFTDIRKWHKALDLIGIVHDKQLLDKLNASLCETSSRVKSLPLRPPSRREGRPQS